MKKSKTSEKDSESSDRRQVYEIGYLLVPSIAEDKLLSEVEVLKAVLSEKGVDFIKDAPAELISLSYTMIKKIGTSNRRLEQAYFGWFKFESFVKDIDDIKKSFEENPNMLRVLVISTVREDTYLGKKSFTTVEDEKPQEEGASEQEDVSSEKPSIEEMDKSIDAMVKE